MLVIRRIRRGPPLLLEWALLIPLLLATLVVVPTLTVLTIIDDVPMLLTVSEVMNAAIGVALATLFLWLFFWHGRASVRGRTVPRRGRIAVAAAEPDTEHEAEPVAVAVDTTSRGLDWANGAARLGIALVLPLLGTAMSVLHPDSTGWWAGPLWAFFPAIGLWFAWEAWLGIVRDDELVADHDRKILSGRSQGPVSRPRSVRLDQLVRVRCLAVFNFRSFSHYVLFVDRLGGRVMVEESREVVQAARWGLTQSMPVEIGGPTTGRLSGRSMPAFHLTIAVASLAVGIALMAVGFQLLGPIGAEPRG